MRLVNCAAMGALFFFARAAWAVEREHHVGIDVGGLLENQASPGAGGSIGAHYTYGLNDEFNFIAEAGESFVAIGGSPPPLSPSHRPSSILNADVGVVYVLDVLQWVPYAGVMAGGYGLSGGTVGRMTFLPAAVLAIGLDYRMTRNLSVGLALREHMFVTELSTYPSYSQLLARVEYTWGW